MAIRVMEYNGPTVPVGVMEYKSPTCRGYAVRGIIVVQTVAVREGVACVLLPSPQVYVVQYCLVT